MRNLVSLIHELRKFRRRHLRDKELTLLVTGELPARKHAWAAQHLTACSACRTRHARFERAFSLALAYHASAVRQDSFEDRARRSRLVARLNQMRGDIPHAGLVRPDKTKHRVGALLAMNPLLITGLVLAVSSIMCVFLWMQQSRPNITSNALLVRAEAWDQVAVRDTPPAVIRQTVKITTPGHVLRHTIFRDTKGKRQPIEHPLAEDEALLKRKLAAADIAWDSPLSATNYQDWHDAQRVREDHIRRTSANQLVLTTTTPNGLVAAQSLTVRDRDFHPVRRTVSFRDSVTVEIAELDYSVLPWGPEVSGMFQPEKETRIADAIRPLPTLVRFPPPALSEGQIDEVELSAKFALNRLHADTGEQIEVVREPSGVEVRGITDTAKRKHQLEAELHMLPHVTASISSIEELKAKPSQPDELSSVKVIEMQTQTTPLETFYLAHGRSVAPVGDLAQRLFNTAFAIHLESRAIDDLEWRFSHDQDISIVASATLTDLLFTHKHKLLATLEDEQHLLADAQIVGPGSDDAASGNGTDSLLAALSQRNLALTKELALSKNGSGRSAEAIASELVASIHELSIRAHAVQIMPQNSTQLDKRK